MPRAIDADADLRIFHCRHAQTSFIAGALQIALPRCEIQSASSTLQFRRRGVSIDPIRSGSARVEYEAVIGVEPHMHRWKGG